MSTYLSWKANTKSPGGLISFDVITSHNLELVSEPTDFPVESGANVTDHIRVKADRLNLEVFVSNTPIDPINRVNLDSPRGGIKGMTLTVPKDPTHGLFGFLTTAIGNLLSTKHEIRATVLTFDSEFSATSEMLDLLNQLRLEGRLLEVISRDYYLEGMVITSIGNPRTLEDGTGARFSIQLTNIRIVETRTTVAAVPAEPRAKGKANAGKKGGTEVDPKDRESVLFSTLSGFFGVTK